jgi:hypothetical protein
MAKYPGMSSEEVVIRRRSRARRFGETLFGLLLLAKNVALVCVALLVLAGGVWTSWGTAQDAMLTQGRIRGEFTAKSCGDSVCHGRFVPASGWGEPRKGVSIDASVAEGEGRSLAVAARPGTDEVVRTDWAGVLYYWVPTGGALVLAALVLASGLRMVRTGWVLGLLGVALMAAAYVCV